MRRLRQYLESASTEWIKLPHNRAAIVKEACTIAGLRMCARAAIQGTNDNSGTMLSKFFMVVQSAQHSNVVVPLVDHININNTYRFVFATSVAMSPPSRRQISFLLFADVVDEINLLDWHEASPHAKIGVDAEWQRQMRADTIAMFGQAMPPRSSVPKEHILSEETAHLVNAFVDEMLTKARTIRRPPLVGCYEMTPPRFKSLKSLWHGRLRVLIAADHIYIGYLHEDGRVALGYWSPAENDLSNLFGRHLGVLMTVFASCLWYDAKRVEERVFRRRAPRLRMAIRRRGQGAIIKLPRVVWRLEWHSDRARELFERHRQPSGSAYKYNIDYYYRRLPEGHRASAEALKNADQWGMARPPGGYTFVVTAEGGPDGLAPRLIDLGLDTAYTVLHML